MTVSFAKIILISIQPGIAVVGRLPGTDAFGDVEQYPMAINIPGVFVVSVIKICLALICKCKSCQGKVYNYGLKLSLRSSSMLDINYYTRKISPS